MPSPVQARQLAQQLHTFTISPPRSSFRPANIPLHTLSPSNKPEKTVASTSDTVKTAEKPHSRDSESADSDFSSWSDTGDLGDQFADEEDPLSLRLQETLEEGSFGRTSARRHKKVHYRKSQSFGEEPKHHTGFAREDIEIPNPRPRTITRVEHILAAIMSGGERQLHGLTGRPLV